MKRHYLVPLASALALSACTSFQNPNSIEALKAIDHKTASPFVEAYFEYAGPAAGWAGPQALMVHVDARDAGGNARVTTQPKVQERTLPADGTLAGRGLASVTGISSEDTRNKLGELAAQIDSDNARGFAGCLSPVRVRLVRQDSSVFEKEGCRTQRGWPGSVSKMVSYFLSH